MTSPDASSETPNNKPSLLSALGPGLLWAGTAVGVSHLVQSTRAGAQWGLVLIGVVIAANLLKYPAFEAAPRYTAATGRSLLQAYRDQGQWALWLFFALTLSTMFTVVAAVTVVTGGMAAAMITDSLSLPVWSGLLLAATAAVLATNRFKLLEGLMKIMVLCLTVSTVICVGLLIGQVEFSSLFQAELSFDPATVAFLAALVGWMPTAIDIAVWQSLWAQEKSRAEKRRLELRGSLFDFGVGYIGTAVLALCFVFLGAAVLYDSGREIPNQAHAFAALFVDLYVAALGEWARPLVLLAAFTTMLSTTITCADGFPRALETAVERLREDEAAPSTTEKGSSRSRVYWASLAVVSVGALVLITFFAKNLKGLVDLATISSFLTAPILAMLNLRAVRSPAMPEQHRPGGVLLAWHWLGLVFMTVFALGFLWVRFGAA